MNNLLALLCALLLAVSLGCADGKSDPLGSDSTVDGAGGLDAGSDSESDGHGSRDAIADLAASDAPRDAADSSPAEMGAVDDPALSEQPEADPSSDAEPAGETVVALAAGDIAKCSALGYLGLVRDPHELTADRVLEYPADTPIITLGDHVYSDGSSLEFATCYSKGWGQFRDRTHPCPGNHDYKTDDAEPYFDFFGRRAGDPDRGYYSFDLGEWRVLSLNSNCHEVGGCGVGSPQHDWLQRELEANDAVCTMAIWHHPRWSSDRAGNSDTMEPFMQALYDADADLVLVGHAHSYERFAPLTPQGTPDEERGIRQFVVGTGGADLRPAVAEQAISELFLETHGVMELELAPAGYAWRFVDIDGDVRDSGSQSCH